MPDPSIVRPMPLVRLASYPSHAQVGPCGALAPRASLPFDRRRDAMGELLATAAPMSSVFTRFATVFAALLLASCNFAVYRHRVWASQACTSDAPANDRRELVVECAAAATTVRSELKVQGWSGELELRLVDPDGCERHRQVVCEGATEASLSWPSHLGTWRLVVEPMAFVGSYSIVLSASDAPIVIQVRLAGDAGR